MVEPLSPPLAAPPVDRPRARPATAPDLRAVLVSYAFPPVGGAGVQRVLKLTKYLPGHGVTPTILTVSNPSVPVLDPSLARDIPDGVQVVRARTLEPGYAVKGSAWKASAGGRASLAGRARGFIVATARQALVPDAQLLWQPAAQAALGRLLLAQPVDVVLISGPPFSQFLLAPLARLRRGTAVVLDYRDEWSTYRNAYEMAPRLARVLGGPLEGALLRSAHAVVTATDEFRANLLGQFPFLDPASVHSIPNGYDPDDVPEGLPAPPADKLVLTYAGTVFKLTSARGLLGGIRRLHEREPALAKDLRVRFFGRIVDTELDAFEGTEALGVERLGYIEHARVLAELTASHQVNCLLADVPGAERVYPGKIFELMYLRRPCLTLAPKGALADLVTRHHLGDVLAPGDEAGVAAALERSLRAFRAGTLEKEARVVGIERYHRRRLAGEFAAVMREARDRARPRSRRA